MKLTESQMIEQISEIFKEKSIELGLNYILKLSAEALMKAERSAYLAQKGWKEGNKANGYRERSMPGVFGTIRIRVPRLRKEVFKPWLLEIINNEQEQLNELIFSLYSKGLSTRDVKEVIEDFYSRHYSESQISRIAAEFEQEIIQWLSRPLENYYIALYIDAIYQKVRLDGQVVSMSFYIVLGLREDYTREVLLIRGGVSENKESWRDVFRELKTRGLERFNLLISDGLSYIGEAASDVYGQVVVQKCVNHLFRNMSGRVARKRKKEFAEEFKSVFKVGQESWTVEKAKSAWSEFISKWSKLYPSLSHYKKEGLVDEYFTYLNYDYRVQKHIYTTNWIESLNSIYRDRLRNRRVMPSAKSVIILLGSVSKELEERGKFGRYRFKSFVYDKKLCNFDKSETQSFGLG